ncbi:MAG: PIN domain-containing protein [Acidobacteriales bacterium]|nr:PIN domain-containing protein [Terriglobales bacterium]
MSEKYFVDTNILIYAHDYRAGQKHQRAQQLIQGLWESGAGVLSTQILQEICVNFRRKVDPPLQTDEVRRLIEDYSNWEVVINSPESIVEALEIELRYKISFWDALVLQAAEQAGAAILYSEDLAEGQNYGSLRVVNPFTG